EIEVNQFKRRANVITRDKALAAKHEQEAAELAAHEKESLSPTPDHAPALAHAIKPKSVTNSRLAKHQSEMKKREAAETENAKQRASNIAAYEKKQQESEARQREIAAKKLEKARAQSNKETAASK
ncbi:MAG: hypothetical protein ACXWJF_13330, partial [Burkholderiaceae bacterium]